MSFTTLLNRTLAVWGQTQTGEDGGGQPIFTDALKGSVLGRVDPRVHAEERNDADLNPVLSDYLAITELPTGFTIDERDYLVAADGSYEILGVATMDGRSAAHHLELSLRRITP